MISLNELLNGKLPTNDPLTQKYYQLLNDKLVDFLDNVLIDIPVGNESCARWIILKDEYDNFNQIISWMVSKMLENTEDVNKIN